MREKMRTFLSSIGIGEPETYDMDFVKVTAGKNYLGEPVAEMDIKKHLFWNYEELKPFEEAMTRVGYCCQLNFVYEEEPSLEDVDSLFRDFCLDVFHLLPPRSLVALGKDKLGFPVGDKIWNKILADFNSLLGFLSYGKTVEQVDENAPAPSLEEETAVEEKPKPVEPVKVEETPIAISEDISEERKEALAEAEQSYLRSVEENRRRQIRHNRSDDFTYVHTIKELNAYSEGNFTVDGFVYETNLRTNKFGKMTNMLSLADDTSGIHVRMVEGRNGVDADTIASFGEIKDLAGCRRYRVSGYLDFDRFTSEKILVCQKIEPAPDLPMRTDEEPVKRVELHLHTKMSAMDGTGDIEDYCKAAEAMGMSALAVTDHGCLQSFPAAERAGKVHNLKIIYGCEFYMFDWPVYAMRPNDVLLEKGRYCVFDFETTGLSQRNDRVTEFGAKLIVNGQEVDSAQFFVNAGVEIPPKIAAKTGITNEMIKAHGISEEEAIKRIEKFMEGTTLVSHNAPFDVGFLNEMRRRHGYAPIDNPVVDTLAISYYLFPDAGRHNLGALSRALGLSVYNDEEAHRADFDAGALNEVWFSIIARLQEGGKKLTLRDLANLPVEERGIYKHLKTYHVVALAKNQEGLKALYRLVSDSSTTYLATGAVSMPKIPRFELERERGNLLLGSACFNGDVFVSASEKTAEDLAKAISFYDYIEIQPKENYRYLVEIGDMSKARLDETVEFIYKEARKQGKLIVATGDAHYVNPSDKVTRDVYISSLGLGSTPHPLFPRFRARLPYFPNPDQHLRTTKEMLDCFREWLPEEEAREVVVNNSLKIADLCEPIQILKTKLYTPDSNLPGSAEKLRALCYENLHKTYGPNPHPLIVDRLEKELNGIISNGYSVTYYIAHLICKKVMEDGYIFGSRGSVGSSFTATMAGVTEVNPLPPHYVCPKCYHFEWADPLVRSGFDLPDKTCPVCGEKLRKNGQSIPFETFLGFHAEKVPDIDLNFPPDYQASAHAFARQLLSTPEENEKYARHEVVINPHVIRAGTVSTAEKKNAFGYIKKFYYPNFLKKDIEEANRVYLGWLAMRCTGVKRTTGQHPGGIVVIPSDMDIFDFTAYQHPADNFEADWLTTHYEFASMHDSVLKLDLLGHVDPQALRMMSLLTGVSIYDIPMDDKRVISLFNSERELHLAKNPLKFKTGAIGLPEFGTNFVQGILEEARPKNFNELLCISGLSHGTNVWHSNAQDIIAAGTATLTNVIGCRDDIMNFLISKGVDASVAFDTMEKVRKGKGLAPEREEELRKAGVPDYYIESCKKIKYLFPRAHATAYVMGAMRVAWFKLYYPLEFYATFFTHRSDKFNLEAMAGGYGALLDDIIRLKSMEKMTDLDEEVLKTDTVALEMADRGFKIEKINIMESLASDWRVCHERKSIIPPFKAISGFPVKTAEAIVEARKNGEFISKEDLAERAQVGSAAMKVLDELGANDGLGESNQMSLFDFSF